MRVLLFLFAIGFLLAIALAKSEASSSSKDNANGDYRARPALLSAAELQFYRVLKLAVTENEAIFAKVRQADILETTLTRYQPGFWNRFNRISQRHVDFVLCDSKTSKVLVVIELNDKTHQRTDRQRRDENLRLALTVTDIRLVEIPVQASYDMGEVRELIYGYQAQACTANLDSGKDSTKSIQPTGVADQISLEERPMLPARSHVAGLGKPFKSHLTFGS